MSASPYGEEKQAPIRSLAEILIASPQKKMQDRLFNQMQDNRALASNPPLITKRKGPRNERDELFDFFYAKVAPAWLAYTKKPLRKAYLAMKISHLEDRDLFFLKSDCLDAERRGQIFSKVFWGSLKPRPEDVHTLPIRKG